MKIKGFVNVKTDDDTVVFIPINKITAITVDNEDVTIETENDSYDVTTPLARIAEQINNQNQKINHEE